MTNGVMSTAAAVAPRDKRLLSGWCASEELKPEIHVAWEKREDAPEAAPWCAEIIHPLKDPKDGCAAP